MYKCMDTHMDIHRDKLSFCFYYPMYGDGFREAIVPTLLLQWIQETLCININRNALTTSCIKCDFTLYQLKDAPLGCYIFMPHPPHTLS